MFLSRTNSPLAGLNFSLRRGGRDRRADMRDQHAQIEAIAKAHALVEVGIDGKVLNANEKFLALLGLTADQVCGHPYDTLVADGDRAGQKQPWDRIGRGETGTARLRHVTKDQRHVSVRIIFTPVYDEDDKLTKFIGLATDETDTVRQTESANHEHLALASISTAVMMVDRDFKVTSVNRATQDLLTRRAADFRKVWPNFDPANIIGTCIDIFDHDPSNQRRMLADPSKLPLRTDISVGDVKFALNVNANYDTDGKYDGNILEWMDVTELRTQQGQLAAIDRVQAVIEFSLDGKILDRKRQFPQYAWLYAGRNPRPASQHVCRSGLPRKRRIPDVLGSAWPRRI